MKHAPNFNVLKIYAYVIVKGRVSGHTACCPRRMKQSLEKNEMTKILVIFRWWWGAVGGGAYSRGQEKNLNGSFSTALFIDSEITEKVKRVKGKVSLWQELLVWGWQVGTCWNSHCLLPWIKRDGSSPFLGWDSCFLCPWPLLLATGSP